VRRYLLAFGAYLLAWIRVSKQPHILIIEDEAAIRTGLTDALVYHGYRVDGVADGNQGLGKALSGKFDLILLDIMLPGTSGFEICDAIRKVDREQPIIMLTAKTSDEDIITGLSLGADDYVGKPFSVAELVLRIKAVLRRARAVVAAGQTIDLGNDVTIDTQNLRGRRGLEELVFTRREMDILEYLHVHAERPVSREELLNKVWGYDRNAAIETRTVDIHVAKLRRKIEVDAKLPRYLITVRGAGYRLATDS
jgi:two-component system response regulator RegX3